MMTMRITSRKAIWKMPISPGIGKNWNTMMSRATGMK